MTKSMRYLKLVEGGNTVKQGEFFTLGFKLYDASGNVVIPSIGQTIEVKLARSVGIVYETTGTVEEDVVRFSVDENIGYGTMRLEIKVIEGTTLIQKYPAEGWEEIKITKSLDDLGVGGVTSITVEQFRSEFDEAVASLQIDSEVVLARDNETTLEVRLQRDKQELSTQLEETEEEIKFVLGTGVLGEKFPRLVGETDDSPRLLRAITELNGIGKLVLSGNTYVLNQTIVLPINVSMEGNGHAPNTTVIDYNGTGFAIKAHSRSSIKNIRIDLNFANSGVLYGDTFSNLSSVPGLGLIDDISISGIGAGQIGIHLFNASHVSMRKANMGYSSNGGIGLKIEADGYNSGVITGEDCVFGRHEATDVGMVMDGTSALDSFTFSGCYFGGKQATARVGENPLGVVRALNLIGCHHESELGTSIELYNVRASNIFGGSIQGYGTLTTAIGFKGGTVRGVNVFGLETNGVLTNVYEFTSGIVEQCFLQAAERTGGTTPTQFTGDFSKNVRMDTNRFRIPTVVTEELFIGSVSTTYGNNAPTTGTFSQGARRINTASTRAKNISHWQCVSSGTPGTWMAHGTGHGTTAERPSLLTNDAGYSYMNTETSVRQYWTGTAWV